jgi:hypothetical protein
MPLEGLTEVEKRVSLVVLTSSSGKGCSVTSYPQLTLPAPVTGQSNRTLRYKPQLRARQRIMHEQSSRCGYHLRRPAVG